MSLYQNGFFHGFQASFGFPNLRHKQPLVKVTITSLETKASAPVIGIMDTGATTSILTTKTAKLLGITNPKNKVQGTTTTATGKSITYYLHPVEVEVSNASGASFKFTLNPGVADKVIADSFGMDWTLNFCLAVDRQSVHLLRA